MPERVWLYYIKESCPDRYGQSNTVIEVEGLTLGARLIRTDGVRPEEGLVPWLRNTLKLRFAATSGQSDANSSYPVNCTFRPERYANTFTVNTQTTTRRTHHTPMSRASMTCGQLAASTATCFTRSQHPEGSHLPPKMNSG